MTDTEHTLIALACIGIAYYVGTKIGYGGGFADGYYNGAAHSIESVIKNLNSEFNLSLKADVQIDMNEEQ